MKNLLPANKRFESLSVILPVTDETTSLEITVKTIMADCSADVLEFIIVVCEKTSRSSLEICEKLRNKYGNKIKILKQNLPFLGGALRDAFSHALGSHILMMASDLETPPDKVKDFISESKKYPDRIITGSRWIKGGGFYGYGKLKYFLNFLFQKLFSVLYFTDLTDMTYGYRLFPVNIVQQIRWEELKHPFLLETIIKPLRLGIKVVEVPVAWKARTEGGSKNTFLRNFLYFGIGLKVLFCSNKRLLIGKGIR